MTPPSLDAGLQAERTRLAWRRTCLALVVAGTAGVRVLWEAFGVAGTVPGFVAVLGGGVLAAVTRRRAQHLGSALRTGSPVPDGRDLLLAVLTVATCGAGVLALVVLRQA